MIARPAQGFQPVITFIDWSIPKRLRFVIGLQERK